MRVPWANHVAVNVDIWALHVVDNVDMRKLALPYIRLHHLFKEETHAHVNYVRNSSRGDRMPKIADARCRSR